MLWYRSQLFLFFVAQIVGPLANNTAALFGKYSSDITHAFTKTPWQGLKQLGKLYTTTKQH